MGTNFYCKTKLTTKQRDKVINSLESIIKNLKNNNFNEDNLKVDIVNATEVISKPIIHLGKRSAGWQFLWDYHDGKYFKPTLESIKDFLKDKDIFDEYDEHFTLEQFINNEIKQSLYKDKNHNNGMDGEYSSHYFISDGLRFSKFENFS